ncbi:MAG: pyruvate kinase [Blastocatellia bacterium]|nr:pyruvate kinase [Chloracidobacterium sp.]MBL8186143.1 pyruvate kinase [Blastocatellia bacterium]HBE81964.1 pyruvate kinase [Blastocatellia bacterium]HRJ88528.1 pyruvate kinase [Pyrinomonadaceae bacterium]HRK50425.1 pyruvate kinase [Pyrinomonadaceae bacterium]
MRRAKILATLGPASNTESMIKSMLEAGVNAVRINMSHGTHDEHSATIGHARSAAQKLGVPLAVLVDLSGPKIRTRTLEGGLPVELVAGETFTITTRDITGNRLEVATNFLELPTAVKPETIILLDDGALELRVESVTATDVLCRIVVGGWLKERKGINLPNTPLPIPSMTEKDHEDLKWAMDQNVDYIALSFVRKAEDCREVKDLIKNLNRRTMGRALLVAKIEKAEAIENLDSIIAETDGVMVARGDLGVETTVEHVPVYQKRIIERAVANDKFVITATQMLQSMIDSPHPTRAEASDVANAVWDGTDAVMLSAETATGSYPLETIRTMARIIDAAETIKPEQLKKPVKFSLPPSGRTSQALCKAAAYASKEVMTEKVAVFTESGLMARRLSSVRSGLQTFALTALTDVYNQLSLIWGVIPFVHGELSTTTDKQIGEGTMLDLLGSQQDSTGDLLKVGEKTLLEAGVVEDGETLIMMAGRLSGHGLSSSVIVWTIGEDIPAR